VFPFNDDSTNMSLNRGAPSLARKPWRMPFVVVDSPRSPLPKPGGR